MNIDTQKSQSGFSLVETLVAITILLIVISGPMSISTSSARSTSFASEQVIAFFLAQEGAELAQKTRDDLLLHKFLTPGTSGYIANPWSIVMDDSSGAEYANCFSSVGCGLEITDDSTGTLKTPIRCDGFDCLLYYNPTAKRSKYTYTQSGGTQTGFSRSIKMSLITPDDVKIESRVSWRTGNQRKSQEVIVESYLYDVYGN